MIILRFLYSICIGQGNVFPDYGIFTKKRCNKQLLKHLVRCSLSFNDIRSKSFFFGQK